MKKYFQMVAFASLTLAMTACYNDDDLWNKVNELETKVEANAADIATLSVLVDALNQGKIIVKTEQTGYGYILTFNDDSQVSILNGKDGKDGVDGKDGKDGASGENGDSFFTSVEETDELVIITLADGRVIKLPKAKEYELRVLTFEDEDYKGSEGSTYWSDFIPTDKQYGNGHGQYEWYDEGNTELAYYQDPNALFSGYGGHAGISNYVGNDWENIGLGIYPADLQAYNVTGGHSGTNFNTHFGYLDESGYGMMTEMVYFEFGDGEARVIDHMWVTNTTYVYNQLQKVSSGFGASYVLSDTSTFKIVAYGYESEDTEEEPTTAEFYLLNTGKQFVTEWTKWDLSVLGKVVKVKFSLVGSNDMVGSYGLTIPAYFAYDDVAVRFAK